MTVTHISTGWLLDATDAAVDRPPTPAVGRDAADGGLGLCLVAWLCSAHGWQAEHDRKHVWARIDYTTDEDQAPVSPPTLPRLRQPGG